MYEFIRWILHKKRLKPLTPVTQMDVKANKVSEYTELSYTSDNIIKTENISDEKDDSNILLPESMEPNAEMV